MIPKLLLALALIAASMPVVAADAARRSHVPACAAVQGAPCQAKWKIHFIGGGAAMVYRR